MELYSLVATAIALSMDAFAVAICKGLGANKLKPRHMLLTGLYFGGFQALMPLIGYYLSVSFRHLIENFDHWIAFVLLSLLGANMIKGAFSKEEECVCDGFSFKEMLPMAIATSIDALAVGITFAFLDVKIFPAISLIGVITFGFSAIGVYIGRVVGSRFKSKAELFGGIVLILIGLKILLEHLGIINF
jgi:putative Mn2+ efflux pump MntP